jgi:hypothetical protein
MDIFGKKRIAKLERELDDVRRACNTNAQVLEEVGKLRETEPEGCVRGPWCKACEFVKTFYYREYFVSGCYNTQVGYMCGKGESCKHFTQRKVEE